MILRPAEKQDRARVSELLAACTLVPLDENAQFGPQYILAFASSGLLAGVAGIERYEKDALLRSVAVESNSRGQALGRRLTEDRLSWAERNRINSIFLLTTDAASYWRRFGFEEIQRSLAPTAVRGSYEWAGACPASAVAMRLNLVRRKARR